MQEKELGLTKLVRFGAPGRCKSGASENQGYLILGVLIIRILLFRVLY